MAAAALPAMFERGAATVRSGWRGWMDERPSLPIGGTGPLGSMRDERGEGLNGAPEARSGQRDAQGGVPERPPTQPAPRAAVTAEPTAQAREQAALNELALRCARGDAAAWNELARGNTAGCTAFATALQVRPARLKTAPRKFF